MKNYLLGIVFPFLLASCSVETDLEKTANDQSQSKIADGSVMPENKLNPFDTKGQYYYELLNLYADTNGFPNSTAAITKQLLFLSKDDNATNSFSKNTVEINEESIARILDNPEKEFLEIISTASLSLEAKITLTSFIENLIEHQEEDYANLYDSIVRYEDEIVENTLFNQREKEIILSLSSICRFSLYVEKKRKDRDWETAVTNKTTLSFLNNSQVTIVNLIVLFSRLN